MQRLFKRVAIGQTQARYMVTYTSNQVQENSIEARFEQDRMLKTLANQPELWNCGPVPYQKLRMYFNGGAWVMELEAVVDEIGVGSGSNRSA